MVMVFCFCLFDKLYFGAYMRARGTKKGFEELDAVFKGKVPFGRYIEYLRTGVNANLESVMSSHLECDHFPVR